MFACKTCKYGVCCQVRKVTKAKNLAICSLFSCPCTLHPRRCSTHTRFWGPRTLTSRPRRFSPQDKHRTLCQCLSKCAWSAQDTTPQTSFQGQDRKLLVPQDLLPRRSGGHCQESEKNTFIAFVLAIFCLSSSSIWSFLNNLRPAGKVSTG